jgi:hypothetical protein
MVSNQLSCLHFYSILFGEKHEDWLPGMEKRMFLRDPTTMSKIIGTYENSIKFSNVVARFLNGAYVNNAGHDAK